MMTQREKLIELLANSNPVNCIYDDEIDCDECDYKEKGCFDGKLADYLIANGVVIPMRCSECEYNDSCMTDFNGFGRKDFDFCPYGERKGGD